MEIKVFLDDNIHQVSQEPGETILQTLINSNIDVPYSCQLGHCSVCKCKIQSGDVEILDDSILTNKEKKDGFILACQSYAKTSNIIINFDYL